MLKEQDVVDRVRNYLRNRGYVIKNCEKKNNQHGCDIITEYHKKWRKSYYIEAKGEGNEKIKEQIKHNAFWTLFGQILSRMDIGGNSPDRGRVYAIAIPSTWEKTFKNKIKKMAHGWKLLKLKVFLVGENEVKERSYSYFLKK